MFTVTLPAGQNQTCFIIPIVNDDNGEQTETFLIILNNVDPGVNPSASISTVQIIGECQYLKDMFPDHTNFYTGRGEGGGLMVPA